MTALPCEIPDLIHFLRQLLAQIPRGRVTTYGRLADALGASIATRWIGHYLLHHQHHEACPCHRVVQASGQLGQYIAGGSDAKARRLSDEGIEIVAGRIDLESYVFGEFESERPLAVLRRTQEALAAQVVLAPRDDNADADVPGAIGGVDVSYTTDGHATAAYALVDSQTRERVWATTYSQKVSFPYISSILVFRELPILLRLIATVRSQGRLAQVVLVDGSGILHPRRAGLASCLGVLAGVPTIGVTKKLLQGKVDRNCLEPGQTCPILDEGQVVGTAIRSSRRSKKLIYVSPGHQVDLAFAQQVVARHLSTHRLPEPLYWADRLGKSVTASGGPQLPRETA